MVGSELTESLVLWKSAMLTETWESSTLVFAIVPSGWHEYANNWCMDNTQIEVGWARREEQLGKKKLGEFGGRCRIGKAPLWGPIAATSAQDQPARFFVPKSGTLHSLQFEGLQLAFDSCTSPLKRLANCSYSALISQSFRQIAGIVFTHAHEIWAFQAQLSEVCMLGDHHLSIRD